MKAATWFWNEHEKRVRAGWRVLLQMALTAGLAYGLYYAGVFSNGPFMLARIEVSLLAGTMLILCLCIRFLDKRNFNNLGTNLQEADWWSDLGFGVILGIIQTVLFLSIALVLSWIRIEHCFCALSGNLPLFVLLLIDFATILCVAIMEETIRAYILRNIAEGVTNSTSNWRWGLLAGAITAGLFSVLMHINQKGPQFWVYVFLRALIYCLAFCYTGRLAIAMSLHLTWDFMLTTVVPLGGANGINAAVLFFAPFVVPDTARQIIAHMNLIGMLLQIILVIFLLLYIHIRTGKLKLLRRITLYTPRDFN